MKKLVVALGVVFALGLVSCKKDYTCCTVDESTGEKYGCSTSKMTKSDAEDVEKAGDQAGSGVKVECTK